jgi:hypothetical protein
MTRLANWAASGLGAFFMRVLYTEMEDPILDYKTPEKRLGPKTTLKRLIIVVGLTILACAAILIGIAAYIDYQIQNMGPQ